MAAPSKPEPAKTPSTRRSYKESRELETLERDLPLWEKERRCLEERLAQPARVDYSELETLSKALAELVIRIQTGEERWLQLSERPE
jgi:ATP-binding cassette subfamily F protein uup